MNVLDTVICSEDKQYSMKLYCSTMKDSFIEKHEE